MWNIKDFKEVTLEEGTKLLLKKECIWLDDMNTGNPDTFTGVELNSPFKAGCTRTLLRWRHWFPDTRFYIKEKQA